MNGVDVVEQVLGVRCRSRADIFENVFTQQTQVNTLIFLYEVPLIKDLFVERTLNSDIYIQTVI